MTCSLVGRLIQRSASSPTEAVIYKISGTLAELYSGEVGGCEGRSDKMRMRVLWISTYEQTSGRRS